MLSAVWKAKSIALKAAALWVTAFVVGTGALSHQTVSAHPPSGKFPLPGVRITTSASRPPQPPQLQSPRVGVLATVGQHLAQVKDAQVDEYRRKALDAAERASQAAQKRQELQSRSAGHAEIKVLEKTRKEAAHARSRCCPKSTPRNTEPASLVQEPASVVFQRNQRGIKRPCTSSAKSGSGPAPPTPSQRQANPGGRENDSDKTGLGQLEPGRWASGPGRGAPLGGGCTAAIE